MNRDNIVKIMEQLGYKVFSEGSKKYFLPVRANIKFNTPLSFDFIENLFEKEDSGLFKGKDLGLKKVKK